MSPTSDAARYSTLTSPEFDALAARSLDALTIRQTASDAVFHSRRYDKWTYDQNSRILRFENDDGSGTEADAQILGSYDPSVQSWEWAWNNPHISKAVAEDSGTARAYGEAHGFAPLTTGIVVAAREEARRLIAVAAILADVDGVYWQTSGGYDIAMGYRNVRWLGGSAPMGATAEPEPAKPISLWDGFSLFGTIWHYFWDPLVLLGSEVKPLGNQAVLITQENERFIVPVVLEYLETAEAALLRRGFLKPVRMTSQITEGLTTIVSLVEHPRDGSIGFLFAGLSRHTGVSLSAAFRSDFAGGIEMQTGNFRDFIPRTPTRPNVDGARFPEVTDVGALYDLHAARVAERSATVAQVRLTRGLDPLAFQDRETRDIQAFWVKRGYYRFVENGLETTLLGAVLAAWRGLFPWKQMTLREDARKAAAIRKTLKKAP